jgi:hypothetical protein
MTMLVPITELRRTGEVCAQIRTRQLLLARDIHQLHVWLKVEA